MHRPPPEWDRHGPQFTITTRVLRSEAWTHVENLLTIDYSDEFQEPGQLCFEQLLWIANCPYEWLGPHVEEIYRALRWFELEHLIPLDNRNRLQRAVREEQDRFTRHGAWLHVMEPKF